METDLIDTNIMIGRFRCEPRAMAALERNAGNTLVLCDTVVAEVLSGVRNKKEYDASYREMLQNFHVLPFTMEVSQYFRAIIQDQGREHGVHFADHLIAATALAHGSSLLTLNQKHFKDIKGLKLA